MRRPLSGVAVASLVVASLIIVVGPSAHATEDGTFELEELTKATVDKSTSTSTTIEDSTTTSEETSTTSTTDRPTTSTTADSSTTTSSSTTSSSTSTTLAGTTSTTIATESYEQEAVSGAVPRDGPPPGGGIVRFRSGVQADYEANLFGDMEMEEPHVLGIDVMANYSLAVEVVEASWVWMLSLGLLITLAILTNVDRRRSGSRVRS